MNNKLTAAQQRAWNLIKAQLALPEQERRIIRRDYNKPGSYGFDNRKRVTFKTLLALDNVGLIEITDMWMQAYRFRLTDAGKAEIPAPVEYLPGADAGCFPAAYGRWQPQTGQVYARAYNDNIRVLVIAFDGYGANDSAFVYGLMLYPDGQPRTAPRLMSVYATDTLDNPNMELPEAAALALTRRNAIIEKSARGESLNDEDHRNSALCGLNIGLCTFPKAARK